MAKRPKPVPQMTAAQFDAAFPTKKPVKPIWLPVGGPTACIVRAAAILRSMT